MIIMATFIGADGSCGYKTGRVYRLKVEGHSIMRLDHTGWCPYQSLRAFFRNWTSVRVVENVGL